MSVKYSLCTPIATALGILALTTSYTPTFAASSSATAKISVKVNTVVAMSITSDADTAAANPSNADTALLPNTKDETMWSKISVFSNSPSGYKLTVADADADTSLVSSASTIPTGTNITAGVSNWALKGGDLTSYTKMVKNTESLVVKQKTSQTPEAGEVINVTYGVSTAAAQASGDYYDSIVYTLTSNDV